MVCMSIFINIASWEDPTLIKTIKSAIQNADQPDDLIFSFALAYKNIPDFSFLNKDKYHLVMFDPENRPGVWKARQLANEFYNGENYYLQIDSHTIFNQGWDTYYKNQIEEIKINEKINKVAISGLHFGEAPINWKWSVRKVGRMNKDSKPVNFAFIIEDDANVSLWKDIEQNYVPIKSVQGGFIFSDGLFAEEIKINRLNFHDEEPMLTFTAFMKGWSIFCVRKCFMFHDTVKYFDHLVANNLFISDNNTRYSSTKYIDHDDRLFSMNNAVIYNDYSVYKVIDPVKTLKEFWIFIELYNEYLDIESDFIELLPIFINLENV